MMLLEPVNHSLSTTWSLSSCLTRLLAGLGCVAIQHEVTEAVPVAQGEVRRVAAVMAGETRGSIDYEKAAELGSLPLDQRRPRGKVAGIRISGELDERDARRLPWSVVKNLSKVVILGGQVGRTPLAVGRW